MDLLPKMQHLYMIMVGSSEQLPMVNLDVSMAILKLKVLQMFSSHQVGLAKGSSNLVVMRMYHLRQENLVVEISRNLVVQQRLLDSQKYLQIYSRSVVHLLLVLLQLLSTKEISSVLVVQQNLQHSIHQKKLHFSSLLDPQNHLFSYTASFHLELYSRLLVATRETHLLGKAVVVSNYYQENQKLTNSRNLQHLHCKIINYVLHTSILEIQVSTLLILNLVVHNSSGSVWKSLTRNTQRYTV